MKKEKRSDEKYFGQIKKINGTTIRTVSYLSQHVCHSLKELKRERVKKKLNLFTGEKEALILL